MRGRPGPRSCAPQGPGDGAPGAQTCARYRPEEGVSVRRGGALGGCRPAPDEARAHHFSHERLRGVSPRPLESPRPAPRSSVAASRCPESRAVPRVAAAFARTAPPCPPRPGPGCAGPGDEPLPTLRSPLRPRGRHGAWRGSRRRLLAPASWRPPEREAETSRTGGGAGAQEWHPGQGPPRPETPLGRRAGGSSVSRNSTYWSRQRAPVGQTKNIRC